MHFLSIRIHYLIFFSSYPALVTISFSIASFALLKFSSLSKTNVAVLASKLISQVTPGKVSKASFTL